MKYKIGSKVKHPKYGVGEVCSFDENSGVYDVLFKDSFHSLREFYLQPAGIIPSVKNTKSTSSFDKTTILGLKKNSHFCIGQTIIHAKYGKGTILDIDISAGLIEVKFKYNFKIILSINDENIIPNLINQEQHSVSKKNNGYAESKKNAAESKSKWKFKVGDSIDKGVHGKGVVIRKMPSLEVYIVKFGYETYFMKLDGTIPELDKVTSKESFLPNENTKTYADSAETIVSADGIIYEGTTAVSFSNDMQPAIVLSSHCTSISEYAFSYCEHLTSIVIPSSVTRIGEGAFSGCNALSLVVLKGRVQTFSSNLFAECHAGIVVMCFENDVNYYKPILQLQEARFITLDM